MAMYNRFISKIWGSSLKYDYEFIWNSVKPYIKEEKKNNSVGDIKTSGLVNSVWNYQSISNYHLKKTNAPTGSSILQ